MLLQLVVVGSIGRQLGAGAGHAERRDRLIDGAVRLRPRIGFRDAAAVEEAGLSPIPRLRDNALSRDGDVLGGASSKHFLRPVL